MPRRTVNRCQRRGARGTIRTTTECDLIWGHVFGVAAWEMHTLREIAAEWRTWGDEITARWIAAYPGSRPFALYVLGQIPPCPWRHEWPACRRPLRPIEGCTVVIPDAAWHNMPRELEHLVELGIVDEDEYQAAVERWRGPDPRAPSRYRSIADQAEFDGEAI
jgi:hypothetical protein